MGEREIDNSPSRDKAADCRTEYDGRNPTEELFWGCDRGGEEESEGVCGGLDS